MTYHAHTDDILHIMPMIYSIVRLKTGKFRLFFSRAIHSIRVNRFHVNPTYNVDLNFLEFSRMISRIVNECI